MAICSDLKSSIIACPHKDQMQICFRLPFPTSLTSQSKLMVSAKVQKRKKNTFMFHQSTRDEICASFFVTCQFWMRCSVSLVRDAFTSILVPLKPSYFKSVYFWTLKFCYFTKMVFTLYKIWAVWLYCIIVKNKLLIKDEKSQ